MAYTPYTQKRNYQHRGPTSSEDYNLRVEENYKDLAFLYNKLNELENDHDSAASYYSKEMASIIYKIADLKDRIAQLEANNLNALYLVEADQFVTDEFDATGYAVTASEKATYHNKYNLITLPLVTASSASKIKFESSDGTYSTSPNLELFVAPISPSADDSTAVVETSQPVYAVVSEVGKVWQRNVIATAADTSNGAQMYLYARIPPELSLSPNTNTVLFDVFPIFGVDVLSVEYSLDVNVNLNESSTWTALNDTLSYYDNTDAVGYSAPGAWSGDEILEAGPLAFFFDQKPITALRIGLRRNDYYIDGSSYVYTYGMSDLDVRYNKFSDIGSAIIRFDAPTGSTISSIDSVQPQIWNVPEYALDDCFSYEVIWETTPNSNNYTSTAVPLSERVWIKITMNKGTAGNELPALSNLIVTYS